MPDTQPATLDEILALENGVWKALIAGDPGADGALLAANFLGVYPSGFSDKSGHTGQLDQGPTMADYTLSDARLMDLGPDRVLLSYLATYRTPEAQDWASMYISSIWQRSGDSWLNIFSQDTPAA